MQGELLVLEGQIAALECSKNELLGKLADSGSLRALLYEKGKPLENAIVKALSALGFSAHPHKEGGSEFDVVFSSAEGRLLGEAEGKDSKAINIEKLRQLEINLHEDFAREEVSEMAKGVLFGNAFRLQEPSMRDEFFTEKCRSAARRNSTALVRTTDLFHAARHVVETKDSDFATRCRRTILDTIGLVIFPPASTSDEESKTVTEAEGH